MAGVLRWMSGLDYDGCCETCRGTGSMTVGPWGARPPRDVCPSCKGEGVDPNGPLAGITGTANGLLVSRRDGWDVLVLPMIVNWRILLGRTGDDYNLVAAFCYQGTGVDTRDRAIAAARVWAEGDVLETDPEGYIKVAADGRAHDYWNRHAGR